MDCAVARPYKQQPLAESASTPVSCPFMGDTAGGGSVGAAVAQPPACVKALIRQAASAPTPVWLQGYVTLISGTHFLLDDGSGTALVDGSNLDKVDACTLGSHDLAPGTYAMVVGPAAAAAGAGDCRVRIGAPTTVRNLSVRPGAPMREALWHAQVAEAWLDRARS